MLRIGFCSERGFWGLGSVTVRGMRRGAVCVVVLWYSTVQIPTYLLQSITVLLWSCRTAVEYVVCVVGECASLRTTLAASVLCRGARV